MISLLEDNTVLCSDGANINSGHPHKTGCVKGSAIARAFTYQHDINYTRTDAHVEELLFNGSEVTVSCQDCVITTQEDSKVKLVERTGHES